MMCNIQQKNIIVSEQPQYLYGTADSSAFILQTQGSTPTRRLRMRLFPMVFVVAECK